MRSGLKIWLIKFLHFFGIDWLRLLLRFDGALKTEGWIKSAKKRQALDRKGNPIPWITYPAIHFLKNRLSKDMLLFEYGAGNSSLWFAQQVKEVYSVEHDEKWYRHISERLFKNINNLTAYLEPVPEEHRALQYLELAFAQDIQSNDYINKIKTGDRLYHIAVIDGIFRPGCIAAAISRLRDNGVMIVDNTDYPQFAGALQFLRDKGFSQIEFTGMGPILSRNSSTSIFYRKNNCFNI
jgi:hypothetical protein